jgi:DNA-binding NarL/FixJ family response regulator
MKTRADPHPKDRSTPDTEPVGRRVLIVDDHESFRALARELLQLAGYVVVGEAADGRAALSASERLRPSIVLLDIQLPDTDGFEVAARLAEQDETPAVVLTSSRDSGAYRGRLAASPARGFIPKAELTGAALAAVIG